MINLDILLMVGWSIHFSHPDITENKIIASKMDPLEQCLPHSEFRHCLVRGSPGYKPPFTQIIVTKSQPRSNHVSETFPLSLSLFLYTNTHTETHMHTYTHACTHTVLFRSHTRVKESSRRYV